MLEVNYESAGAARAVLRLQGRFDLLNAAPFRSAVSDRVREGDRSFVVDLAGVAFMDSSGVGALIGGLRRAREAGGDLRIARLSLELRHVLHLTTVDRILPPYDTVEEALDGL